MTGPRHHAVAVPATTANLGPGFDAFGLALANHLAVRSGPRADAAELVETTGQGAGEVSTGADNLVWRSLIAFCEHHDVPVPDVGLRVHNEVPLERGLGSSSAAIVAGLVLARALTGVAVGDRDLVALADELEGHPDNVAPALLGGLVACARDPDGRLVVRRVNPAARLRPLVLVPENRSLTVESRATLPESLARADAATQAARAGHVLAGVAGVWPVDATVAGDLLHEPARLAAMAPSGRLVASLREAGLHAWLSGAGPSVAALVPAGSDTLETVAEVGDSAGFVLYEPGTDLAGAICCPDDGCALGGGGTSAEGNECVQCPRRRV